MKYEIHTKDGTVITSEVKDSPMIFDGILYFGTFMISPDSFAYAICLGKDE